MPSACTVAVAITLARNPTNIGRRTWEHDFMTTHLNITDCIFGIKLKIKTRRVWGISPQEIAIFCNAKFILVSDIVHLLHVVVIGIGKKEEVQ